MSPAHPPRSGDGPVLDVSVVVIGRNEGARLARCIASIDAADWGDLRWELIYVDSDSTDDSVATARRHGAQVRTLDGARPSAAAARNIGWRAARAPYVLFLDGDTVLERGFVRAALQALTADAVLAGVWGHRRELDPAQSIYTRVLDLDWVFAPGRVPYFGGDVLVRRAALLMADGFDASLVAGEEPELCRRLRAQGWQIEHIDEPMTRHDLAIRSFGAWWRRAERAGLAYAQVSARYAATDDPLWLAEARRNRRHGGALLALPAALVLAAWLHWLLLAALVAGLVVLWCRSGGRARWKASGDMPLACWYAAHSHLQQLPILVGQLRWWWLQQRHRAPTLIEYKGPADPPGGGASR